MGLKEKFNYKEPFEIFEEIRNCVPQYKGITYERLNKPGGIQWPCPSEGHPGTEFLFKEKFATTDGLGHFQVAEYKKPPEIPDNEYPYILTTGRILFHFHSGTMTRRTDKLNDEVKNGFAEINVDDAKEINIKNGDEIVLKSKRGEIKTIAKVTEDIKKGVIFMPWHFSESAPNVLTGPIAGPPSRMPEFKFCPVKLERIIK